jgi:hypothetical protein
LKDINPKSSLTVGYNESLHRAWEINAGGGGGAMLERWLLHCHWFLVCARRYVWYSLGGEESEARRGGIMAMLAPHVEAANAALDPLHTRP